MAPSNNIYKKTYNLTGKNVYALQTSRPTLWLTQHPIQWEPGVLSPGAEQLRA